MKTKTCCMTDGDCVRWEHDGKTYMLLCTNDPIPMNPRRDCDNISVMACDHRRYDLGDDLDGSGREKVENWMRTNIGIDDLCAAIIEGKVPDVRVERLPNDPKTVNIYETYKKSPNTPATEELVFEGVNEGSVFAYVCDDLETSQLVALLNVFAETDTVSLYDHSGITMSLGGPTNPWDSGIVGLIWVTEKAVRENWPELTNEESWRAKAREVMEGDVEAYDLYLREENYCYELFEFVDGKPQEVGDGPVGGYLGMDITENGILNDIGFGLKEAIETDAYDEGRRVPVSAYDYKFSEKGGKRDER